MCFLLSIEHCDFLINCNHKSISHPLILNLELKIIFYLLYEKTKNVCGSILIEALISIVILGVIVIGSFYSYSFVHQRILHQRQQRKTLGMLQGWMEETRLHLLINVDPNILMDTTFQAKTEAKFREKFAYEISNSFISGTDIAPNIDLSTTPDNKFVNIRIWATLNNLPVVLFTQISLETIRQGH